MRHILVSDFTKINFGEIRSHHHKADYSVSESES